MTYRVLVVGNLMYHYGNLAQVEYRVQYEPQRAVSVAYADKHYVSSLTSGYSLICL